MLRIHLFGSLRLSYDGQPHRFVALPKTLPLLAWLLLHREKPASRSALAFALWPDVDEEKARTNLRRHLHELRRALPPAPEATPWFEADASGVWWNRQAPCWVDVDAFARLEDDPARLAEAVSLYTGDLLPEVDEEWLLFVREQLRSQFLDALRRLVAHHRGADEPAAALAYVARYLQHDPLAEAMVRESMRLRAAQGDPAGALLEYRRFEARLRQELDVAPTVETSALYDAIAHQMVAPTPRPAPAPAQETVASTPGAEGTPHNLPAPLTSFVGRARELADVRAMLGRSQDPVRLLTLTGPGGSGKSRLAIEAARRMLAGAEAFADGIYFVPLAALDEPSGILRAVASALNMAETDDRPLVAQLVNHLRRQQLLLILDNFEHLGAGAPLVAELLAAIPGLTVLVTSRASLRVYGEHEYPVAPLPLPEVHDHPTFEIVARNPAVELFVIRSRAANPAYVLRPADAPVVAEICVKLDGLPLAIELAAARSKLYTPQALLTRLASRLEFLENRARQAERRHQTLRATLDWSYQLLGPSEQRLLAALAVFARTFSLDGVEAVCADTLEEDTVAVLSTLCDHSLVQLLQAEEGTRFGMLATVHEYADGLLAEEVRLRLQQRHAEYYAAFAQQAERALYGTQQASWLAMLRQEEENLRAALAWSLAGSRSDGETLVGIRIAKALARYWQIAGRLGEGRGWLSQAVAARNCASVDLQVEVLSLAGLFAQLQGDHAAASALHEEVLALASHSGNAGLVAQALYALGTAAGRSDDPVRASQHFAECLAIRRRLPPGAVSETQLALTLNNLAVSYLYLEDYAQARPLLEESLALKRRSGDQVAIATALVNLGDLALREGDLARAEALQRESIQLRAALDDKLGLAKSLDHLGDIAAVRGDFSRAATLFAVAQAAHDEIQAKRVAVTARQVEARLATVRAALSEEAFAAATARGARMSLDEGVRFALTRP